jgi:hypothetical protein
MNTNKRNNLCDKTFLEIVEQNDAASVSAFFDNNSCPQVSYMRRAAEVAATNDNLALLLIVMAKIAEIYPESHPSIESGALYAALENNSTLVANSLMPHQIKKCAHDHNVQTLNFIFGKCSRNFGPDTKSNVSTVVNSINDPQLTETWSLFSTTRSS